MIRIILITLAMLIPQVALATSGSATAYLSSNYIYKGLSYTNGGVLEPADTGGPALQGSFDIAHDWFGFTLFTGNVNSWDAITFTPESDVELDAMVYANIPVGPANLQLKFSNYNYVLNPINNMLDFAANVSYDYFKATASFSRMPGWSTDLGYLQAAFFPHIAEDVMLTSHVGYNTISTTEWGYSNYIDYKLGVAYMKDGWYTELYYTNTLGRLNLLTDQYIATDDALTLTVAKTFSVFAN